MCGTTLHAGQSITSGQRRDIRKLLNEAFEESGLDRAMSQRVLGKGGDLKAGIKELIAKLAVTDLLELVATVALPAIGIFRTLDHFKVDRGVEVPIGWIGDNFRCMFLSGDGKLETDVAEATLRVHRLVKSSADAPIIAELGGEEVAETTLAYMFELMKRQNRGQDGVLLTNGWANIFYIRDAKGVLWAVFCNWYSGYRYWYVEAVPVTDPNRWYDGYQVISR